ncbi:MAG: hypothetical protein ACREBG_13930 [Pyrinomonadaceae bacterium]
MLRRLETSKEYVSPGELAVLYAALDKHERAFASLKTAYAARDLQSKYLGVDLRSTLYAPTRASQTSCAASASRREARARFAKIHRSSQA